MAAGRPPGLRVVAAAFVATLARSEAHAQDAGAAAELACTGRAAESVRLDEAQVRRLCAGAESAGPVDCFAAAVDATFLDVNDAIELCRTAESAAPVRCYESALEQTGTDRLEALRLCRASGRLVR